MADADGRIEPALLPLLERAVREGRVTLALDFARLTHIDSPVVVDADSNLWIYAGVAASLAGFALRGPWIGGAVALLSLALYLTLGKRYVRRRLAARVRERALMDDEVWRRLWLFGGIALAADGRTCTAPSDSWRQFVRHLAPDASRPA